MPAQYARRASKQSEYGRVILPAEAVKKYMLSQYEQVKDRLDNFGPEFGGDF